MDCPLSSLWVEENWYPPNRFSRCMLRAFASCNTKMRESYRRELTNKNGTRAERNDRIDKWFSVCLIRTLILHGVQSASGPWLGWLWSWVFCYLPDSVWADGITAETAEQLGKMVEHPNPSPQADRTPCTMSVRGSLSHGKSNNSQRELWMREGRSFVVTKDTN